ncbi:phosphotransferase system enzyme I (PtsI) [Clostridium pascui]|uniref:phosphoenolpyruvate--protein phosphotransferase n=1 Tax=Clostridium pascui TaxID=46609 RepID=UPI001A9C46AA|nr:phosphoenolpyruvate--protein phosphotransferase [Clostridium pascui]MBM7871227.1 phosphotransferase system enzyme I (PtsI) [Clostridium pascui]
MFRGISASPGIAIGRALLLKENKYEILKKIVNDSKKEKQRLENAVTKAKEELKITIENAEKKLGKEKVEIFEAHLLMLDDPEFIGVIISKILYENVNAEYAVKVTSEDIAAIFETLDDRYMKERAADVRDVSIRLINILMEIKTISISNIQDKCILIAHDLTPSNTAQIDKEKVLGFITEIGGVTSHSAIIARTIGVPAVVGLEKVLLNTKDNDLIILDGNEGLIIINPDESILKDYKEKIRYQQILKEELIKYKNIDTKTMDGIKVEVSCNIGSIEDLNAALENGAEGIGLFRTEFLYMSKDKLPTEDEQFNVYKEVLENMNKKSVIIRTLDIGGDKELSYLKIDNELNPFLGYRAIRLCLGAKYIFKVQLRALLKASNYGNLKIMFPMICNLEEIREAKKLLEECKEELKRENIEYDDKVQVGIMIEVPSAAIISDILAEEVDFLSIGTNDLMQYTLAVDRMNEKVSYLYDFYNPAVLRLINIIVRNASQKGKYVGMCGEMAGKKELIPLLIGMGLREFSMNASSILEVRKEINNLKFEKCRELANKLDELRTSKEVRELLNVVPELKE